MKNKQSVHLTKTAHIVAF